MHKDSKPKVPPKILKLNKAFKLAEAWVNNMSGSIDSTLGELAEVEYEGRIPRLGLGAKVPENAKPLTDPVERKLLGKFNAYARQSSESTGKASADEECEPNEDDNDDEPESRAKSFVKKRSIPPVASLQSTKRRK